jgi:hypothetical protein
MVLAADAVISIGGGVGTDSILELAWIAEKVMIPIPSSGGASAECWDRYGSHLNRRLRVRDDELNAVSSDASTVDDITRACLTILERHLRPRCFVAMAFGDKHPVPSAWEMYEAVLADRGFNPTRMDKQAVLGSVIQAIWTGIRQADVVIADISGWNANVFYELGIAHALTKPVIITVHSAEVGIPDGVPFDIADQRIVPYSSAGDLAGRIDGELKLVRNRLGVVDTTTSQSGRASPSGGSPIVLKP